jgi:class 3 adenylate cyclase
MPNTVDLPALLARCDQKVADEFAKLPEIVEAPDGFDPWTSPIEARRWLRIDDAVAVVADLRNSTKLSLSMTYRAATAAMYEAATGNVVPILNAFGADFVAIQGDGAFGLFWGDKRYGRALCAAITVRTFSEKTLAPRLATRWPKAPETGYKVAMASSSLLVKRIGVARTDHQEPVWPGKAVNFATKAAQQIDPDRLLVTDSVWRRFENNDYVTLSCDCNEPTDSLWCDEEIELIPEGNPDRFGRALTSQWCATHGAEYCQQILEGKTVRAGVAERIRSNKRPQVVGVIDRELLVVQLLQETRDEITRVDSKTSILLAGLTALNGALVAVVIGGRLRVARLPNEIEWIAWIVGVLLLTATGCLLVALWPHLTRGRSDRPHYFGDFATFSSPGTLIEALDGCDIVSRNVEQLRVLSIAVLRKYRWMRRGIGTAALAGILLAVVMVGDQLR